MAKHDIEVTNVKHGTTFYSEISYFTGGLIGMALQGGSYGLMPIARGVELIAILDLSWQRLNEITDQCGSRFVGSNQVLETNVGPRNEIWKPSSALPADRLHGAESWSAISLQARIKGDREYEDAARYVSVSIQAAGIRLRDVAKGHHDQLRWALEEGMRPGSGFTNIALFDLYLDFHSLATELCAARDHLARVAAITVGAKDSIDSMARLEDWLRKPVNADLAKDPLTALLLIAWGSKESPSWLQTLGDIRNQMVHKQPMAANPEAAVLRLVEVNTTVGPISTIRLAPLGTTDLNLVGAPDPFVTLLNLYNHMEQLVKSASGLARYPPEPLAMLAV